MLSLLVSSGLSSLDAILGGEGYPEKSAVLAVGAPGVGKEALGYWFTQAGLVQSDFCLYITRLSVREVLQDEKAFGIEDQQRVPLWMAGDGGQIKYNMSDLASLSYNIKEVLEKNSDRRIRVEPGAGMRSETLGIAKNHHSTRKILKT
jgi:KaiC/GvpD/RAD55 family RecA-like ATPase